MTSLILSVVVTLGVSAICSLLEAFILSVSTSEIEYLKKTNPRLGRRLESFKTHIDATSSAILTLNTVANTLGATLVGYFAAQILPDAVALISGLLVFGILFGSEIVPKNLGFAYRRQLLPWLVWPIGAVRFLMWPISSLARYVVRPLLPRVKISEEEQEQEIILLAEKHAKDGSLTTNERDMISNALSLDDVTVEEIMTPRTVVTFVQQDRTVEQVCEDFRVIPFARLPVYGTGIDNIVGLVRRRDILQALAEDKEHLPMKDLMHEIVFLPETATGDGALQIFLKKHQQFGLVVDEYGSTAGVLTMEDIFEHILGREIYEDSDIAIDMRELARRRAMKRVSEGAKSAESSTSPPMRASLAHRLT
jgi:CBS domain containing-hemolysin-like protein